MYVISFKVAGTFDFPVDMLRYDSCFPASQDAVSNIHIKTFPQEAGRREVIVELRRYAESKTWTPTDARWRSFGWKVIGTPSVISARPA